MKEHCLLGREWADTADGQRIGLGLLILQFGDRARQWGIDPDVLARMISLVRRDEHAPNPEEPFSLRWFDQDPARIHRLEGQAHKSIEPSAFSMLGYERGDTAQVHLRRLLSEADG